MQLLAQYPQKYKIGDKVRYHGGWGYVSCIVFNDRAKDWKYTIQSNGVAYEEQTIIEKM